MVADGFQDAAGDVSVTFRNAYRGWTWCLLGGSLDAARMFSICYAKLDPGFSGLHRGVNVTLFGLRIV